ncbi:MAG: NAD(+)/NADH kinase [Firmicutes bacterium]|nr:NAD(+)/NADH kinase [Bacillota bacterium]
MKTIGIITNTDKDDELVLTRELIEFIHKNEYLPAIIPEAADYIGAPALGMDPEEICARSEFIIVLGGDGTMLRAAGTAAKYNTPILGINLGTLGYLTDSDAPNAKESLKRAMAGESVIEKRMMIRAEVVRRGLSSSEHIALNDICVTRGAKFRIMKVSLSINDYFVENIKGDGIIVSTPTGSTAYNLSAGGPIVKPDTRMMVITPVCTHTLNDRSIVISDEDVVKIVVDEDYTGDALFSVDGEVRCFLEKGDTVTISHAHCYSSIIKTNKLGFYDILRKKLDGKDG